MKTLILIGGCFLGLIAPLSAGNFDVDHDHSHIQVEARATPPHTVTSYVRQYETDIQLRESDLQVEKASFSFKLKDFDSAHEKRDQKMHSWIESLKFPEVSFTLSDVKASGGGYLGTGKLTMHGVSREIEIPFSVSKEGNTVKIDGSAAFSYEDWDLEIIRLFLFRVRPELKVAFHLEGVLSEAS